MDVDKKDKRLRTTVQSVMGTVEGRRLMSVIIDATGLRLNPIDKEPHITFTKVGAANVGRYVEGLINQYAPEMYLRMLEEFRHDTGE